MSESFLKELPYLIEQQLITEETAKAIQLHYSSKKKPQTNSLFAIFGVLGAILVGLGIILILAHNWDNFSRSIKTIIAFVPLLIGQGLVAFSFFKKKSVAWKEASGVFLFFAVGASISLVSQIYNISGDLASFLLTWIVLCVPLIYIMRSHAVTILHLVFCTWYACLSGYFTKEFEAFWYFPLLALAIPFYWKQLKEKPRGNLTSIYNWLFPLSLLISLPILIYSDVQISIALYILLFGCYYNIGKLSFFEHKKLRQNGYLILGSLGTVFILMITSFRWFWEETFTGFLIPKEVVGLISFLLVTLFVLWYNYSKSRLAANNIFQYLFIIYLCIWALSSASPSFATLLLNILVFGLGITAIQLGVKRMHFGILNYGLLIIAILIICRFFDTNLGFAIRGLLFVLVGAGFFAANYIMLKKQKESQQ